MTGNRLVRIGRHALVSCLVGATLLMLVMFLASDKPVVAGPETQYYGVVPAVYVYIGDNYFWPSRMYIRRNTVVLWVNNGRNVHTVTSGIPSAGTGGIPDDQSKAKPPEVTIPEGMAPATEPPADYQPGPTAPDQQPGAPFDSGDLQYASAFAYTFREPGTYYFYCRHHPNMRGVVYVY